MQCIASSLQFLQHCLSVFQSISFNLSRFHSPCRVQNLNWISLLSVFHLLFIQISELAPPPGPTVRHKCIFILYA